MSFEFFSILVSNTAKLYGYPAATSRDFAETNRMPSASQQEQSPGETWDAIVLRTLKANAVKLVVYVPDRLLTPLIKGIHADSFFTCFPTAREEEAIGLVSGAWMGGMPGAVLMQTSGFATLANVLASLVLPYQIPAIMLVSNAARLGSSTTGRRWCAARCARCSIHGLEHHTITRLDELEFIADRSIRQAVATQAPVALILSPLLTGGKVFKA